MSKNPEIFVCTKRCDNERLLHELNAQLTERALIAKVVEAKCLRGCKKGQRLDVFLPDGSSKNYAAKKGKYYSGLGDDPVGRIIRYLSKNILNYS